MGVFALVTVKYPTVVDPIDAYLTVCVYDVVVLQDNAYMGYVSFGIVKEGQVPGLTLFYEA